MKMQICNVYKYSDKTLTINEKACQEQANGIDSGVFAVANMFHIVIGINIGRTKIWEDKMRHHLLQCIKSRHFQGFEESSQMWKHSTHCFGWRI